MSDTETKQLKAIKTLSSEDLADARSCREASRAERIARLKTIEAKPTTLLNNQEQKILPASSYVKRKNDYLKIDPDELKEWRIKYNASTDIINRLVESNDYQDLFLHAAFLLFDKRFNLGEMSDDRKFQVSNLLNEAIEEVVIKQNTEEGYQDHIPLKRQVLLALREIYSELNGD